MQLEDKISNQEKTRKYLRMSEIKRNFYKANPRVIYKIVNPNGKVYIGQTINLLSRVVKYQSSNCKAQPSIYNSIMKYGWENHYFKIMHTFHEDATKEEMNDLEKKFIIHYKFMCAGNILNVRDGGGSHGKMSVESRIKMSKARMGKIPWNKGIKTYLIPKNKGTQSSKRSYIYFKDGEEIVVHDLKRFCVKNRLTYSAMIEIQSENGITGKKGEYKGYTKTIDWLPPVSKKRKAEDHPKSLFTNDQIVLFRKRYNNGERVVLLAIEYNCNEETMRNIVRNRTYKSVK